MKNFSFARALHNLLYSIYYDSVDELCSTYKMMNAKNCNKQ